MKETNIQNAGRAFHLTAVLTFFVAGFEVLLALFHYQPGMSFFNIANCVTVNPYFYCLILILANLILLPGAMLLYRQNGLSLKDEIIGRKTWAKDILYGVLALVITEMLQLLFLPIYQLEQSGMTNTAENSAGVIVLRIIALVLVSGICKEIYFRGIAKTFCGSVMGETTALLLFNVMFAMLDWYNIGFSFVAGLVWIWAYKKSGHLIACMIAHGGANLIGICYMVLTSGGLQK